ncbi:MAG TPA: 50S ribosomal protein L15 [Bryobacteraceae bacterium]|nr:50S ribosomal protein L15 [Bryobacteraceae bacterium]
MNLSDLKAPEGQNRPQKRIGRGMGSRRGKTSGRGHKGARSVSGYSKMRGFEGGQMPMHRRLPKRGFTNIFRKEYTVVNLDRLNELEGDTFDFDTLSKLGVVKKLEAGLKILGTGDLTRAITVTAHAFSGPARQKIEAAGGKAVLVGESQEA